MVLIFETVSDLASAELFDLAEVDRALLRLKVFGVISAVLGVLWIWTVVLVVAPLEVEVKTQKVEPTGSHLTVHKGNFALVLVSLDFRPLSEAHFDHESHH